jgi:hypothetical protein
MLAASDMARFRVLLLGRLDGRPRSIMDDSEMFLLCDADVAIVAMGSRLSTLGDPRLEAGDAVLNGFVNMVGGVGRAMWPGERRLSTALRGVLPPDVIDAGVISWVLLGFEFRTRGVGEPLRSAAGDLGGT